MDYGYSEKRNKGKDKKRERKKHPYRQGGAKRNIVHSGKGEKK